MHYPSSLKYEWQLLVGTLIISFGELEKIIYSIWVNQYPLRDPPRTLNATINKLTEKLKHNKNLPESLSELLVEVRDLLKYRNTIAHNPLSIQTKPDLTGKITPILHIKSVNINLSITKDQLKAIIEQSQHLVGQLTSCYYLQDFNNN